MSYLDFIQGMTEALAPVAIAAIVANWKVRVALIRNTNCKDYRKFQNKYQIENKDRILETGTPS